MKALTWHGKSDIRCETRAGSEDRARPRRHHQGHRLRDLRLRPASLRRRDPDDGEGRRARPRDHGRGGRGRRRQQEAEGRRPRRRALHHLLRRMLLLPARLLLGLRALQPQCARWRRSCGAIRRPACSAIRICSAAIAGGQAEYLRVPYADVGPIKVPDGLTDEQVLFLSDIFPTGYMAADFCNIQAGDTVAIWGCGPVGQFAIKSAFLLGAERVIAIDTVPERLAMARAVRRHHARFQERGHLRPDPGADRRAAAPTPASMRSAPSRTPDPASTPWSTASRSRPSWAPTGRTCCARRSTAAATSAPSRSSASMAACSTRSRWARRSTAASPSAWRRRRCSIICRSCWRGSRSGEIDPSFVITHRATLEEGPELYKTFRDKQDGCIKVVMKP